MHSFLLISHDETLARKNVDEICKTHHIHELDKTVHTLEKAIGIEDIRTVQKNLSLAPVKSPLKATILSHADTMTIAAQNALLKTLEEPPAHTLIFLLAKTQESFLPTILSRCTVLHITRDKKVLLPKDTEFYETFFQAIPTMTIGEKLKYAEVLGKNKESALNSLENGILFAREYLFQPNQKEWTRYIRQFQKTHTLLSNTNTNPRLALEQMLLSI